MYNMRKISSFIFILILIISLMQSNVSAQVSDQNITGEVNNTTEGSDNNSIASKDIIRWGVLGGMPVSVFLFGLKTWDWGSRHDPKSEKEGWFGESTSFGGADKAGHFWAHYGVQRGMYTLFDWTENGANSKWWYSLGTTMGVGLLIEVGDAYTSTYGFSYEDLIIDYVGILVGALLDYSPILDGFFGFSIEYIPSAGYRSGYKKGEMLKYCLDVVNDYSGNQYIMNFKPAGFRNLGFDVPLALRLLSIDVGWYTRGYTKYDKGRYPDGKERDIFIGVSINSAQLLSEIWPASSRGTGYKVAHTALEYYQLPYDRLPVPTRYTNDLNK